MTRFDAPCEQLPFSELQRAIDQRVPPPIAGDRAPGGLHAYFPEPLRQLYYRCRRSGVVSIVQADRFALALGLHPCEIWTEWGDC